MKKVKLFLTVSTFCVAAAAVAGTKANAKFIQRGYTESTSHKCNVDSGIDCDGTTNNCLNGTTQLFQLDNSAACSVQLKQD